MEQHVAYIAIGVTQTDNEPLIRLRLTKEQEHEQEQRLGLELGSIKGSTKNNVGFKRKNIESWPLPTVRIQAAHTLQTTPTTLGTYSINCTIAVVVVATRTPMMLAPLQPL